MTAPHEQLAVCRLQFRHLDEMHQDIKDIKKVLQGNGSEGLVHQASRNTAEMEEMKAWRIEHDADIKELFLQKVKEKEKKSRLDLSQLSEAKLMGIPAWIWLVLAIVHGPNGISGLIKLITGGGP